MPALQIDYRNADLKLEFDEGPSARLYINNIQRVQETADQTPCTLRLSSSVQTDYEWHEFIEAIVTFGEDETIALIVASNTQIARETFPAL